MNALKQRNSIRLHCEVNQFIVDTPLKSIVSSVLISEVANEDILRREDNGLDGCRKFAKERLVPDTPMSDDHNEEYEGQYVQHVDGEDTECRRQDHQAPRKETAP